MSTFQKQFGPYGFETTTSQYNVQSGLGSPSADSHTHDGEREWTESPLLGTWSQSRPRLDIPNFSSASESSKNQDPPMVSLEERPRPDIPISPTSTSERFGGDYISATAVMSPLDRTMSGESEDGRFSSEC